MSTHSARMSYGANMGLSRLHCRRCNEETLHRMAKCIHCGTQYEVVIPPSLKGTALLNHIDQRNFDMAQAKKRKHRRLSIAP
jgi:hypothetical protein